jgi:hypothetical protein
MSAMAAAAEKQLTIANLIKLSIINHKQNLPDTGWGAAN